MSGATPYGVAFFCPGCREPHHVPTLPTEHGWTWDGNLDAPTLSPSILRYETKGPDGAVHMPRCHSFVRSGRIEFCSDSGHALAGKTVELPEWRGYEFDAYPELAQ